jgi:hypothetical protein
MAGSLVFTGKRYEPDVVKDVLRHKAAELFGLNFEKVAELDEANIRHVAKVEYDPDQDSFEGTDLCAYVAISACIPDKIIRSKPKVGIENNPDLDVGDDSYDMDLVGKKKVTKNNVVSKLREFFTGF